MATTKEGKNKGLKVLKAEIKNFKNIDYREVEFEGKSAFIVGVNGKGKSSLIQAISSPMNSKTIPAEPIKQGEEKGHIVLTIGGELHGEEVKYSIGCYFSQEHKRGRLVLKSEEGTDISPAKSNISAIIGDISFDIMEFIRMAKTDSGKLSEAGVKKQIELVKSLMPKESVNTLNELDFEKEEIYSERTEVNRDIKYIKADLDSNKMSLEEIEKYKTEIKASDISERAEAGREVNAMINKCNDFILSSVGEAESIEEQIVALNIKKQDIADKKAKCTKYLTKHTEVDVDSLLAQMDNISAHNSKCLQLKELKVKEGHLTAKQECSDTISSRLAQIEKDKLGLFTSAKLPVKGLTFNNQCVMFEGLPLTEEQHPTSRLIAIGLKIGMALNPNLRLLVIKDGSLLDPKTMTYILKMCDKEGYQLLIEMVAQEDSGEEVKVEFIEK